MNDTKGMASALASRGMTLNSQLRMEQGGVRVMSPLDFDRAISQLQINMP
jgi:hypothetical protein